MGKHSKPEDTEEETETEELPVKTMSILENMVRNRPGQGI